MKRKKCAMCGKAKPLTDYFKNAESVDGRTDVCKQCKRNESNKALQSKIERYKRWKDENDEYYQLLRDWDKEKVEFDEFLQEFNDENDEYFEQMQLFYNQNYKQHVVEIKNNRKLMYSLLPNTLTEKEWFEIMELFDFKCCLSNSLEDVSQEHFIALTTGHGGTTKENIIPLRQSLNASKSDVNPFNWVNKQNKEIRNVFYREILPYLARVNDMSVEEYKLYVNWCYEFPRTAEHVLEDKERNITSKDLFYKWILANYIDGTY